MDGVVHTARLVAKKKKTQWGRQSISAGFSYGAMSKMTEKFIKIQSNIILSIFFFAFSI